MAKKGGVQQLQADIASDEDFEKFLEKPGLLVIDVYAEWCGPCVAMIGSLRKIKLELGGDNLQLAICKADTITALKRFRRKCEPIWLFVANGKAVNIMFGTDVPRLMALIAIELEKTLTKADRQIFEITELQPIEVAQLRIREEQNKVAKKIEHEAAVRARLEYLHYVTDSIMENLPDFGVSVFGPQVNRDMFKKLSEAAEPLKMQCKDRKVLTVTKDDFETINFACDNPLLDEILELLYNKELLICFWKVDEIAGNASEVLLSYATELTRTTSAAVAASDDETVEAASVQPLISAVEVQIDTTNDKGNQHQHADQEPECGAKPPSEEIVPCDENVQNTEQSTTKFRTIVIPPIWVPTNARTHAALIYVFFRNQTAQFLPPDPDPEAPHVVMTFDAYKKKDIINLIEKYKEYIPLYGFFSNENPTTAQLIANSIEKYNGKTATPTDKMIVKVITTQEEVVQALLVYGPSYISPNTVAGRQEARQFFPENYVSDLQEQVQLNTVNVGKSRKRKKNKRQAEVAEIKAESTAQPLEDEESPKSSPEEGGGTTSSGDESTESQHPSVDRSNIDGTANNDNNP